MLKKLKEFCEKYFSFEVQLAPAYAPIPVRRK